MKKVLSKARCWDSVTVNDITVTFWRKCLSAGIRDSDNIVFTNEMRANAGKNNAICWVEV